MNIKGYIPCARKGAAKFISGKCQIVNLSDIGPGTHWVSHYMPDENTILYFDAFGLPPYKLIEKWKTKNPKRKVFYSSHIIQNDRSSSCGWYCLNFLKRVSGGSIQDYIDFIFNYDLDPEPKNENKINNFIGEI